jgi:hypothetical protein
VRVNSLSPSASTRAGGTSVKAPKPLDEVEAEIGHEASCPLKPRRDLGSRRRNSTGQYSTNTPGSMAQSIFLETRETPVVLQ